MANTDNEADKALKAVEKMEDEAAGKETDESGDVIACPKCKRPVTEGDYINQLANTMEDSAITKINCPQCGYSGLPIEMSMSEYQKWLKEKE
jgi:DNA-directed RNA polymerase subunit RPC12/RpoP